MRIALGALYAGEIEPLGAKAVLSGINKRAIPGPWRVRRDGLVGDAQAGSRHHGGPEKALHHYPRQHYAAWIAGDPGLAQALTSPGAFGENVSTLGIDEDAICIGDVFAAGSALIQVSQGRQPCWKLNLRFDRKNMAQRVQQSGRTGWYYRVLREGVIEPGDALELVERPRPDWPLSCVHALLYHSVLALGELSQMMQLPELSPSWRALAAQRIETRNVEDWAARLDGPLEESKP
jgi:MOSC domain-containing protein YiiM